MHLKRRMAVCIGGVALVAGTFGTVAATTFADGTTPEVPTPAQTATLSPAQKTMLNSGQPINVTLNPANGDITNVTSNNPLAITASIMNHSVCNSGNACYSTNQAPYANQGFYGGSGTITGSWPFRNGYSAGNWTVSACWSSACGIQIGPGSDVGFTSDVTGTSFTIYPS
jgi:hypothetical protein